MLYPASQHGVARLEFFDCKEPAAPPERLGTRRLDKTVVRLADCTSVAPVAESGPRAGMSVFRLETSDRSYLFATDKQQSEEWVAKLCEIAFPVSPGVSRGASRAPRRGLATPRLPPGRRAAAGSLRGVEGPGIRACVVGVGVRPLPTQQEGPAAWGGRP